MKAMIPGLKQLEKRLKNNHCLHADRAGLGIFWKACTDLDFDNFWEAFLVTRPAGEANVGLKKLRD